MNTVWKITMGLVLVIGMSGCSDKAEQAAAVDPSTATATADATPQSTSKPTHVSEDHTPPVIIVFDDQNLSLMQYDTFVETGVEARDDVDGAVGIETIGKVDTDKAGVYLLRYTAVDAAGNRATIEQNITVTPFEISWRNKTYGVVRSPYTGKMWLDRNLGAVRVCQGMDDQKCFGEYYQWGRQADGHQDPKSNARKLSAERVTEVGHGDFILSADPQLFGDWAYGVDANGSLRKALWRRTDGTSVCPKGYRVPTRDEWKAELLDDGSAKIQNRADAYASFLKLPVAGFRDNESGDLNMEGEHGDLWSSSVTDASKAVGISFDATGEETSDFDDGNRASGLPVRCIKK